MPVKIFNTDKKEITEEQVVCEYSSMYVIICTYAFYASSYTVRQIFQSIVNDISCRISGKEKCSIIYCIDSKLRYFHFRLKFITKFICLLSYPMLYSLEYP